MNLKEQFAKQLKYIRKQRNYTQEQLAEMVSVDPRHISYLETAHSFPSCELIEKLCKALNITYSQLFNFNEEIPREELMLKITNIMNTLDDKKLFYVFKIVSEL